MNLAARSALLAVFLALYPLRSFSEEPVLTVTGATNQALGWSVLGIGDVDGDSVPDFAAGSPLIGGTGQVDVFSGSSGSVLYQKTADFTGASFGISLASLGDVDADTIQDFAVMAQGRTVPSTTDAYVRVFSGAYSGGGVSLRKINFPSGGAYLDAIGAADVNGDGKKDVLVAYNSDVYAYEVSSGSQLRHWQAVGGHPIGYFGVTGVGDWNGDGNEDVAFCDQTGLTWVVSGANDGMVTNSGVGIDKFCPQGGTVGTDSYGALTCVGGASVYQLFSMGDLNGDHRAELAARGSASFLRIMTFNGSTTATFREFALPGSQSSIVAAAPIADLDGDEVRDLILVKDPGAAAALIAYFYSTETGDTLGSLTLASPSDKYGDPIAEAGDVDGDGIPDLAVGAMSYATTGKVGLFTGKSFGVSGSGFYRVGSAFVPH